MLGEVFCCCCCCCVNNCNWRTADKTGERDIYKQWRWQKFKSWTLLCYYVINDCKKCVKMSSPKWLCGLDVATSYFCETSEDVICTIVVWSEWKWWDKTLLNSCNWVCHPLLLLKYMDVKVVFWLTARVHNVGRVSNTWSKVHCIQQISAPKHRNLL